MKKQEVKPIKKLNLLKDLRYAFEPFINNVKCKNTKCHYHSRNANFHCGICYTDREAKDD